MLSHGAQPLVVAHRGASRIARENSLEAFAKAIEIGADMVEFDVRRTADRRLIAFHDELVEGRPICEWSFDELAAALGHPPPRLDEIVYLCAGRIRLDVELKERGTEDETLGLVTSRFWRDEFVVTSFLVEVVAAVKRRRPDVRAGLLLGVDRPDGEVEAILREIATASPGRARPDFAAPHVDLVESGRTDEAARLGVRLYVWTVNEPAGLRRCLADPRIEAVITDDPGLALAIRGSPELRSEQEGDGDDLAQRRIEDHRSGAFDDDD